VPSDDVRVNRKQRERDILSLVEARGELSTGEVCRRFSISPATARRIFARLAAGGAVEKTWGGLARRGPSGDMLPSGLRDGLQSAEKDAIARAGAALVADGDVVVIDGGTTTLRLAPHLADRPVRIVTNSILIAHRIDQLRSGPSGAEVFLTGGYLFPGSGLLVGPEAVANLRQYHSRWAFLSSGGLDPAGATNTNRLVVESEQAMIAQTENAVILADSGKWDRRDMVRQCAWGEIGWLVTDRLPASWRPPLPPARLLLAGAGGR